MSPSAIHCGQNWGPWGWACNLLAKRIFMQFKLDSLQLSATHGRWAQSLATVYALSDAIDRSSPASLYLNCIILAKQTKAWLSGNCRFSNLHISLSDNILTLSQILWKKIEFWIWLSTNCWAGRKIEKPNVLSCRSANRSAKWKERNVLSGCNISYTHSSKICAPSAPFLSQTTPYACFLLLLYIYLFSSSIRSTSKFFDLYLWYFIKH